MRLKRYVALSSLLVAGILHIASAAKYTGVLEDPLALGAWLYRSKCTRCHSDYDSARLAENYDSRSELLEAMSGDGCQIDWSRIGGGPFSGQELNSLAAFMMKWEDEDKRPKLPELPPLQFDEAAPIEEAATREQAIIKPVAEKQELPAELRHLVDTNPVAKGGWLYTNNCYRCHLSYEQARMGKGLDIDAVQRTISEGKTSTQMTPFSRMLGGTLKNDEIKSIATYIVTSEQAGEPLAVARVLMTPPAQDPADFVPLRLTRYQPISGDDKAGAVIYAANCRSCHGTRGEGYIGPTLREVKPSLRPDLFFKSVIKQGVPGSLMISWEQTRGGTLTAKDIDDVVFYLANWGHPS